LALPSGTRVGQPAQPGYGVVVVRV